jgi:molybdopterin molybdotransferase
MTGAMVPAFYDAVIPFEAVVQPDAASIIVTAPVASGSNIRLRGEDVRIGDHLLDPGDLLSPVRIGLLAAIGRDRVLVHARPRVAILSTGDELASAAGVLSSPARIHDSNGPMLAALVQHAGGDVVAMMRIGDDPDTLRTWLNQLDSVDFIISTGGISAGDSDYLHNLSSPDVQLDFWQVAIRPGKPLGFGHVRSRPWLALPGNPGAAAVSFWQFGWPALRTLGGHRQVDLPIVPARLTASIENRGGRRAFVRAHLEASADGFIATPIGKSGSGMIGALAQANALIIILEARDHANAGDMCSVQRID